MGMSTSGYAGQRSAGGADRLGYVRVDRGRHPLFLVTGGARCGHSMARLGRSVLDFVQVDAATDLGGVAEA